MLHLPVTTKGAEQAQENTFWQFVIAGSFVALKGVILRISKTLKNFYGVSYGSLAADERGILAGDVGV